MDSRLTQKRQEYRQALDDTLKVIVRELSAKSEVRKIILFGSYAAGRRDLFTDLDVIVVMETDLDLIHRTTRLYQDLQVSVDLDLLVYTPAEWEAGSQTGFVRRALETGQVLYEK